VSLNPGARPSARPGCPARMPDSCVAGFTDGQRERRIDRRQRCQVRLTKTRSPSKIYAV